MELRFDNERADLEAAKAVIDALLAASEEDAPAPLAPPPPPTAPATAWNVAAWFGRLGEGSRRFWTIAARYSQSHQTFTFDELAADSGLDKETLRSYQRNSYRAIRAVGAPDPLGEAVWNAEQNRNTYSLPDAVRDEIIRLSDQP
jgi:hypothetical protein